MRRSRVGIRGGLGALLLVINSLVACPGCSGVGGSILAPVGPLRVASDLDHPPFAFVDEKGRPAGSEVEMMERIAAELGRALEWRRMAFEDLIGAVVHGEAHIACATIGITPERGEIVRFSRPYYETRLAVVGRVGEREPASLEDLTGRRIGAARGTTSERAVRSVLPAARGVFEPEPELSFADMLRRGTIDAAVMDGPDADELVARNPDILRRIGDLGSERYALVLRQGDDELLAHVDRILARLAEQGTDPGMVIPR